MSKLFSIGVRKGCGWGPVRAKWFSRGIFYFQSGKTNATAKGIHTLFNHTNSTTKQFELIKNLIYIANTFQNTLHLKSKLHLRTHHLRSKLSISVCGRLTSSFSDPGDTPFPY